MVANDPLFTIHRDDFGLYADAALARRPPADTDVQDVEFALGVEEFRSQSFAAAKDVFSQIVFDIFGPSFRAVVLAIEIYVGAG